MLVLLYILFPPFELASLPFSICITPWINFLDWYMHVSSISLNMHLASQFCIRLQCFWVDSYRKRSSGPTASFFFFRRTLVVPNSDKDRRTSTYVY